MTNIVVPELGESVVEARVARWLKKEGDRVEIGDPLVELETEKVDLEVNADKGGVLASIKRREGEDVKIGELLGVVDETAAAAAAASGNGAGGTAAANDALRRRPAAACRHPRRRARRPTRGQRRLHGESRATMSRSRRRPGIRSGRTRDEAGRRGCDRCESVPPAHLPPQQRIRARPHANGASGCRSAARRSPGGWSRLSTTPRC